MPLAIWKALFALTTLAACWLGVALITRRSGPGADARWLGGANAFAAGLFLGAGLLHLLAEGLAAGSELGWRYPWAPLLAALAFLAILGLEHVLLPDSVHAAAHDHGLHGEAHPPRVPVSAQALVIALSVHSVLGGLALGVATELADATVTFAAIAAHKTTEGAALAAALLRKEVRGRALSWLVGLWALSTPAGILVGGATGGLVHALGEQAFDVVAQSLAAGAFLYIGAFDLLQDEFLRPGNRGVKWLWALGGLSVTAIVAIWA